MKNFESQYNRWLDGHLQGAEREAFEAALDDQTRCAAHGWPEVRAALKESAAAIPVPHPDFLNAQVLRSIGTPAPARRQRIPLGRLVWAGALCLATAGLLALSFLPRETRGDTSTTVVSAWTAAPDVSAGAFPVPGGRGTVIWLEGAGYIPGEEKVR